MKLRIGFVSNSSTSSYVIVCSEDAHKKALEILHPYYQKWLKSLHAEKQKFAGLSVRVVNMTVCSDDEEPMEWDGEYPKEAIEQDSDYLFDGEDDRDDAEKKLLKKWVPADEILSIYEKALRKVSKDVIFDIGD